MPGLIELFICFIKTAGQVQKEIYPHMHVDSSTDLISHSALLSWTFNNREKLTSTQKLWPLLNYFLSPWFRIIHPSHLHVSLASYMLESAGFGLTFLQRNLVSCILICSQCTTSILLGEKYILKSGSMYEQNYICSMVLHSHHLSPSKLEITFPLACCLMYGSRLGNYRVHHSGLLFDDDFPISTQHREI